MKAAVIANTYTNLQLHTRDATRPTCGACYQRMVEYRYAQTKTRKSKRWWEESKQRQAVQDHLVDMLRLVKEAEDAEILCRVEAGAEVKPIENTVYGGDMLMQPWLAPESTRRFEITSLAAVLQHVFIKYNLYLRPVLYDAMLPPAVNTVE